jgi:hypothetical protein
VIVGAAVVALPDAEVPPADPPATATKGQPAILPCVNWLHISLLAAYAPDVPYHTVRKPRMVRSMKSKPQQHTAQRPNVPTFTAVFRNLSSPGLIWSEKVGIDAQPTLQHKNSNISSRSNTNNHGVTLLSKFQSHQGESFTRPLYSWKLGKSSAAMKIHKATNARHIKQPRPVHIQFFTMVKEWPVAKPLSIRGLSL